MSPEREFTPIEALPPEEQERVAQLETRTDEIWKLRSQLGTLYHQYRQFLPEIEDPTAKSGKRRMRIAEVAAACPDVGSIRHLLPLEKIAASTDVHAPEGKSPALVGRWRQMQVENAFRRAVNTYRQLEMLGGAFQAGVISTDAEIEKYYRMRWREFGRAKWRLEGLRDRIRELEELRDVAKSDAAFVAHPDDLRAIDREIEEATSAMYELIANNPEAYLYIYGGQLQEIKQIFDAHGRIVETPYVCTKLERICELEQGGRPVFIHGELGSGKTELAKHIARTRLSAPHVKRWEQKNPPPDKKADAVTYAQWEARRADEAEALLISGLRSQRY